MVGHAYLACVEAGHWMSRWARAGQVGYLYVFWGQDHFLRHGTRRSIVTYVCLTLNSPPAIWAELSLTMVISWIVVIFFQTINLFTVQFNSSLYTFSSHLNCSKVQQSRTTRTIDYFHNKQRGPKALALEVVRARKPDAPLKKWEICLSFQGGWTMSGDSVVSLTLIWR